MPVLRSLVLPRRIDTPLSELLIRTCRVKSLVVEEARLFLAMYAAVFVSAILLGYGHVLLWCWAVPSVLGQPFLRFYLLAEHTGCQQGPDMMSNTRTTITHPLYRYGGSRGCLVGGTESLGCHVLPIWFCVARSLARAWAGFSKNRASSEFLEMSGRGARRARPFQVIPARTHKAQCLARIVLPPILTRARTRTPTDLQKTGVANAVPRRAPRVAGGALLPARKRAHGHQGGVGEDYPVQAQRQGRLHCSQQRHPRRAAEAQDYVMVNGPATCIRGQVLASFLSCSASRYTLAVKPVEGKCDHQTR